MGKSLVSCFLLTVYKASVCVESHSSALNVTLLTFAAERRRACSTAPAAIDRYSGPQGTKQQTRRLPLLLLIDGTDRRIDGRRPDRYIDSAPHSMRAA